MHGSQPLGQVGVGAEAEFAGDDLDRVAQCNVHSTEVADKPACASFSFRQCPQH